MLADASIFGRVFYDQNYNGIRDDSSERWVKNSELWIDKNGNGVRNSSDASTRTDSKGGYRFDGLQPGTYGVHHQRGGSYSWVNPRDGVRSVTLAAGQAVVDAHVAIAEHVNFWGTVTIDDNGDGKVNRNEERRPVTRRIVWIDSNKNGLYDDGVDLTARTDRQGRYEFYNVPGGELLVRPLLSRGESQSRPRHGKPAVLNLPPATQGRADFLIAPPPTASISGTVFDDVNGDGIQYGDEEQIFNDQVVYIDSNSSGTLDAGERRTETDGQGRYSFTKLYGGSYRVTPVVGKNQRVTRADHEVGGGITTLSAGSQRALDFGVTKLFLIAGRVTQAPYGFPLTGPVLVFVDVNDDGEPSAGEWNTYSTTYRFSIAVKESGTYAVRWTDRYSGSYSFSGHRQINVTIGPSGIVDGLEFELTLLSGWP